MNFKRIQHYLDKAAVELDRQGHKDLADKIDKYCARLARAKTARERKLISRGISQVEREASRREGRGRRPASRRRPVGNNRNARRRTAALRARRRSGRRSVMPRRRARPYRRRPQANAPEVVINGKRYVLASGRERDYDRSEALRRRLARRRASRRVRSRLPRSRSRLPRSRRR